MADVLLPDGSLYRFDDGAGVWRHVPDVATANAMGVDWNALDMRDSLPGPAGDDWPSVEQAGGGGGGGGPPGSSSDLSSQGYPELARLPDGRVFLLVNGVYRWIPDQYTLSVMGLGGLPIADVAGLPLPQGPDLPSLAAAGATGPPPGPPAGSTSDLVAAGYPELARLPDGRVFLLVNGVYRWIPDPYTLQAMGLGALAIANVSALPLPQGPDLPSLLTAGGGDAGDDAGDEDTSALAGFRFGGLQRSAEDSDPKVTQLPAAAWIDLRDTLAKDVPYVGHVLRTRGRGMRAPLASDLWSASS